MLLTSQNSVTVESGRSAPFCVLFSSFLRHSGRTPLHLAASEVSEPAKTIELLEQPAAAAAADTRQRIKAPQRRPARAPSSAPPAVRRPLSRNLASASLILSLTGHLFNDWLWGRCPIQAKR